MNSKLRVGLALVAAVSLTACGGSKEADPPAQTSTSAPAPETSKAESPTTKPTESATSETPTESVTPTSSPSSSSPAPTQKVDTSKLTKPATILKFGQPARVLHTASKSKTKPAAGVVTITINEVKQGKTADLKEINLKEYTKYVPYYVNVSLEGQENSESLANMSIGSVVAFNADGKFGRGIILFSKWNRCPRAVYPKDFGPGKKATGCVAIVQELADSKKPLIAAAYAGESGSPYYETNKLIVWKK